MKIDEKLITNLRLNPGVSNFTFKKNIDSNSIVPENETHEYLLKHFPINDYLKRFYYSPVVNLISDKEFEENFISLNYGGKKETVLLPYSLVIDGAYYSKIDVNLTLKAIKELGIKNNGEIISNFFDLEPYFSEYRKGFKNGFLKFEKDCIENYLPPFSQQKDFVFKVFEYVTKHIPLKHSWFNTHSGISFDWDNNLSTSKAVNQGEKQGYWYKAWSIILSNSYLFAPHFEEYFKSKEPEQPEQQEIPDSENLHSHIFNNNAFEVWKSMFDAFNITESDRSHVKFMFEEMRKDGLIHKTITQKHFLDWVSETYNIAVGKTNNYSKTDERISIYSTAKQRYKSKDTKRT